MPTYFSSSNSIVISVPRQKPPSRAGGRPTTWRLVTEAIPSISCRVTSAACLSSSGIGEVVEPEDLLQGVSPLGPVREREVVEAEVGDQPPVEAPPERRRGAARRGPQAADPRQRRRGLQLEREPFAGLLEDQRAARGWCRSSARPASTRPAAGDRSPGPPGSGRPRCPGPFGRSDGRRAAYQKVCSSSYERARAGTSRTAGTRSSSPRSGRRR